MVNSLSLADSLTDSLASARVGSDFRALLSDSPLKPFKVIADGHGEGEEFFEGLLGVLEAHGDLAGGERNPSRKVGKHLVTMEVGASTATRACRAERRPSRVWARR